MKEDRQVFKNRMRSLRTYREQNPGKGYWEWKKAIQDYKGIDIDNDPTYDYYGFYKENPEKAKGILNDSKDAHFTDTYKTSVHPTFSNESKYSGYVNKYNPKGVIGGYWGEDNSYNFSDSQIKNNWDIHNTLRYLEDAENHGVTAKYRGMYPKDTDDIIYGGVLPQVEVRAQAFYKGGETLPTRGTTVTNAYGDKTHYIATSMDDDGTLNLSLPDIEITPRNNLNLAGSVSKAMDNVARSGVNAATYVTPLGDVEAVYDIGKNVSAGNYGQAALGAGLMLLPNFIEKPIKRIGKLFKKSKVKKELEDVISLSDNIDEVISNDTPININENNIDKFEYNTNTSNDILPSEKIDTPVVEDIVSESTPNIVEQNITTVDNSDLFADLNQLRSIDEFQKYYEEGLARDRGLFDQRFDDAVYELREGIQNNEDLITRYQNLSSLPNTTLQEVENLTDDLISNNYVRRNIKLCKSNYLNQLYDQYNQSRQRLPSINDIYNLRNNIIDRQRIETIRSRINEATEFRDRIRSIPVEERTQELYDQLQDQYNNIFSYIPTIVRNRENTEIVSQLTSQLNNLQNEVSNIGKELLENRGQLINNSNNYHSSISSVYNINNTNYNNLISDNLYDKNNLSKEFTESKYNVGDVTNAIYFSLNPKQAVQKGIDDFNKLKHGQAWNLTHDRAVSTDSYPLQLSLMTKYKDNGFIKVFRDKDNNVQMMRLNDFGRLKGDAAISRINKKLQQISEITGEEGLKAVLDGESILVPKILYRKYKDGGEVEPPYPQFVNGQRVNRWTGQPIATGQATPVFDLRDAADFTPAGDVLAVKDTYEAVQNNDWVGAGLAAVGVLPFVPSVTKKLRREIPTVNKNYVSDAIDALDRQRYNRSSAEAAMNNETYEIVQRLMDDPSYMRRANEVKYRYGDDYLSTYADLINAYNYSPELLPKAKVTKFEDARRAQMIATPESANRHRQGGEFPKLGEYEYQFDPDNAVEGMTLHELDHQVDFLKNKVPDADGNSNMFYRMRQSLKPYSDGISKYYSNPTEQKAYMNQLREFMYKRGMIKTRDEQVTKEMLQEAMNKLPKSMSSIIDASKRFKSMRAYTKWFNQIPLLTAGALGINRYYNQQQEQ